MKTPLSQAVEISRNAYWTVNGDVYDGVYNAVNNAVELAVNAAVYRAVDKRKSGFGK